VRTATTFRALLVAPSRHGPYLRRRSASVHLARVDVVVLIETKSLTAADDLRRRQLYRVLDDRVHAAARYVYSTTATNVKRIGPVDHSRAGVFLFNYFVADRQAQNIAVWHYMAGWFQQETRLDDGRHAVLCALGAATPLRRDDTLVEGVQHVVDAMIRYGTRRLVYVSFLGVREGRRQLSFIGRTVVAPLLLRNVRPG
jgi:hypothetical protein